MVWWTDLWLNVANVAFATYAPGLMGAITLPRQRDLAPVSASSGRRIEASRRDR
jgi:hypothetical protein